MMKLNDFNTLKDAKRIGEGNLDVKDIVFDSRQVTPGSLFIALKGATVNGEDYISQAISAGAIAVVLSKESKVSGDVPFFYVEDPRRTLAMMAREFYPLLPEILTAVTGTNGKTSIVEFTRQFFEMQIYHVASLGTMGVQIDDKLDAWDLTTPDPMTFYGALDSFVNNDRGRAVCFEASSDGLDQGRILGLEKKVRAAGFTNLTKDHLVTHGTMENYFEAKFKLFSEYLADDGVAVLNVDDPYGKQIKSRLESESIFSYGKTGKHFQILKNTPTAEGQNIVLGIFGRPLKIKFPLMGEFQLYNALCALGLMFAGIYGRKIFKDGFWVDYRYAQVRSFLQQLKPIRGRLEHVGTTKTGAPVFVDYAHTADGLETVLKSLRPHTTGLLTVIFGIGGARHQRANMGKTAEDFADKLILTDDNPRDDDPAMLRDLVKQHITQKEKLFEIPDRKTAIETAIEESSEGDCIVIAGKGHETYQLIKGVKHPFDDRAIAQAVI
ncbi:MAG: UDP-N-acetylmuramoyl-L-alanyl-D-glutamate--2,6-diaminopimelate ligase [Alphaproteobacteria bacterium]|nr:UDP-N-acetylmuramoyl-L-alanyl-D-glutamate--2,6-diaminopimelate ligase [Alphaproteobacteria bacterium]MBN2779810.1 UDP-N-acetylmuramoyl-L-alanyl-D-glutamate--2,6-diaminopimelate ligase [Alphaproteobacteria bacterium]